MKFEFEAEALRLLVSRSEKASNRFLDFCLAIGFIVQALSLYLHLCIVGENARDWLYLIVSSCGDF
ncbi:hypothetical protein V466_25600 [Pseudomonas mandelii PD30]|uniref:Uncharacterized protein n=1 Tax=Pseudomonas mandelii PD30 TaxID=1419583 RepID=A0A059KWH2_9PSED|nr:hypothetical protein V466_25600 [Pseudomonas mandelii PD30]